MPDGDGELGARLRALRHGQWDDVSITQRQLSTALGISGPLLSSWENGTAVPPEERLYAYARFFSTRRSMQGKPHLVPSEDLNQDEERRRGDLVDELVSLRDAALSELEPRVRDTGQLGGRFWYFPDGQRITILCTPMSLNQLGAAGRPVPDLPPVAQYTLNRQHPNSIRNTRNGDIDALLELVGHIRAENPTAQVRWRTQDHITSDEQLTGHVVVLGGADPDLRVAAGTVGFFKEQMRIPVDPEYPGGGNPEFDGYFTVAQDGEGNAVWGGADREIYRPRFLRDEEDEQRPRVLSEGAPMLEADVALIARKPNPLNTTAKVTILGGVFSRGTYGAVRAFTDPIFRARNEQWLTAATKPDDFWLLAQVPVFNGERTMTPDLSRASSRLRMST